MSNIANYFTPIPYNHNIFSCESILKYEEAESSLLD